MEDLIDDDFGDLYADVEVQACSAINAVANFTKLHADPDPDPNPNPNLEEGNNDNNTNKADSSSEENLVSDSKQFNLGGENLGNLVADGSDSEDDLNIVLNDEDFQEFTVTGARNGSGSGYEEDEEEGGDGFPGVKNGASKGGLDSSGNGLGGDSGNGVKGGYSLKHPQYKQLRPYGSSFASNKKVNESVGMSYCFAKSTRGDWEANRCKHNKVLNAGHGGYGFSLPWYRTILDVKIDEFEEKRWRYPGVDVSDFFNFGFDEDSWKQYCMSLEQLRQQPYIHSRIPVHEYSKPAQAYETKFEHEGLPEDATAKDTAQVGCSSNFADKGPRQLGLPKGRAIQVEDSIGERQPTMDLRRPRTWDSDVVIQINVQDSNENTSGSVEQEFAHVGDTGHEAPKRRQLTVDDTRNPHHSGSVNGDELDADTLGGNRCSQTTLETNQKSLVPDNHQSDRIPDANASSHQKVHTQTSEDIAEAKESFQKAEEEVDRTVCKSNECLNDTELSLGDQSHFSLTLSCSESDSELSEDSIVSALEASLSPLRKQSPGTELQKSVTSHHKSPKRNSFMRKQSNSINYLRSRSPLQERGRHWNGRFHRIDGQRIHLDTVKDVFPIYRDHSSIDCYKQIERLQDFDYRNTKESSYDRERDSSCSYSERFADSHFQAAYRKHFHKKYHHNLGGKMELQDRRNWDEEYFHGISFRSDNWDEAGRHWHNYGREPSPDDMIAPTFRESKRLVSKSENFEDMGIQWRSKSASSRRTRLNGCSLDHKNGDQVMQEKHGRSISVAKLKRSSLDKKRERERERERETPFIGKEVNISIRRVRHDDCHPMDLDGPWLMEDEEDYWNVDHRQFSPWPHRESYAASEERRQDVLSPKSGMFNPRLTERYGRHKRQICDEEHIGSGLVDSHHVTSDAKDGIIYSDDHFHLGRRKCSWRSRMLLRRHDESLNHQVDELHFRRFSQHERSHGKYIFSNSERIVDDMQLECYKYKLIRGGSSGNYGNGNLNMMHEHMVRRCSRQVGLIVGQGKSSRRFSSDGNLMCMGKHEKMDPKFAKEHKFSSGFCEFRTGKSTEIDVKKSEDGKKWPDKFPVTEHNEDNDNEGGQIRTEANIEDSLGKKCVSQIEAATYNAKKIIFASGGKQSVERYDNQWIQETLARMEKRRERFKDPVAVKKEVDETPQPVADLMIDTVENKQERPARKRRWNGSQAL